MTAAMVSSEPRKPATRVWRVSCVMFPRDVGSVLDPAFLGEWLHELGPTPTLIVVTAAARFSMLGHRGFSITEAEWGRSLGVKTQVVAKSIARLQRKRFAAVNGDRVSIRASYWQFTPYTQEVGR